MYDPKYCSKQSDDLLYEQPRVQKKFRVRKYDKSIQEKGVLEFWYDTVRTARNRLPPLHRNVLYWLNSTLGVTMQKKSYSRGVL